MKWFEMKLASVATPSRPRSLSPQINGVKVIAGVGTSVPLATTLRVPAWLVTRMRPSGVNARAVGVGTDATRESEKFCGRTLGIAADGTASVAALTNATNTVLEKVRRIM